MMELNIKKKIIFLNKKNIFFLPLINIFQPIDTHPSLLSKKNVRRKLKRKNS